MANIIHARLLSFHVHTLGFNLKNTLIFRNSSSESSAESLFHFLYLCALSLFPYLFLPSVCVTPVTNWSWLLRSSDRSVIGNDHFCCLCSSYCCQFNYKKCNKKVYSGIDCNGNSKGKGGSSSSNLI